jgi:hypothetical protein
MADKRGAVRQTAGAAYRRRYPVRVPGANTQHPSVSPQATAPFSLEQRASTAHDALTFM